MLVYVPDTDCRVCAAARKVQIVRAPCHVRDRSSMTTTSFQDGPILKLGFRFGLSVFFALSKGSFGLLESRTSRSVAHTEGLRLVG